MAQKSKLPLHKIRIALLLVFACCMLWACRAAKSAEEADPLQELKTMVENVPDATAYRYHAQDSAGHTMDTAKIIPDPQGGYLAVYHAYDAENDYFVVHLATSSDLLNWTYQQSYGEATHQPYLAAVPGGGFLLANETDDGSHNWVQMRYYASRENLLANQPARTFDAPHTLVPEGKWAEGTPNIISVSLDPDIDHSTIEIGFHFYKSGVIDRQARGVLVNFSQWTSTEQTALNEALQSLGAKGNIGDRDQVIFHDRDYIILEGQLKRGDFGSWRVFLWDVSAQAATQLDIHTHGGSQSFANPTLSILPAPEGGQALVVSLYIPSENSASGEAGELIYYRLLP